MFSVLPISVKGASEDTPSLSLNLNKSIFLKDVDSSITLSGSTATSASSVSIHLYSEADELVYSTSTSSVNGQWSLNSDFGLLPAGRYYVMAQEGSSVTTSWFTYVDTGNWVSDPTFPIQASWKGVNYTLSVDRTLNCSKGSDWISFTFPDFTQMSGLTQTVSTNSMAFRCHLEKAETVNADLAFVLAHNGLKFYLSGTQNIPRSFIVHVDSSQPLHKRLDSVYSGNFGFDFSDLRVSGIQFSYDNGDLEISAGTTFFLDPTIFSDGFESGDFSAWTATSGTPVIVGSPVHHGSYAAEMDASNDYITKDLGSEYNQVWMRTYVRVSSLPSTSGYYTTLFTLRDATNGNTRLRLSIQHDGTNPHFFLWDVYASTAYGTVIPVVDTWYCLEIYGGAVGYGPNYLWVDGVLDITEGSSNGVGGTMRYARVGLHNLGGSFFNTTENADCVVVADAYIGPEAGDSTAPTYSSLSASSTVAGATNLLNFTANDETDLTTTGGYILWSNVTGTGSNSSWAAFTTTPQTVSESITNNQTVGQVIGWEYFFNDTAGNWNSTGIQSFTITDGTVPTYSGLSTSTTIAGASCNFNATFNDETALPANGQYLFATNNTGAWVWESAVNFTSTPESIGVTKTLNSTVGQVVGYRWNITDNVGNANYTAISTIVLTDGTNPTFGVITSNSTVSGAGVLVSCTVSDNNAVDKVIFSWNNTGIWTNQTTLSGSGISYIANHTGTWNSTVGTVVSVIVYANDTTNNWAASSQKDFTLTGYTLTLQARDMDSTNLPRAITFTVVFPDSSTADYTSNTAGLKAITTCYGTHNVTTKWGTHTVKSLTSIPVTANTSSNLDTLIARLDADDATKYLLFSLDGTTLPTPQIDGEANFLLHTVAASGSLNFKADLANWRRTDQPTTLTIGTHNYNDGQGAWTFASNILSITETFEGTQDITATWQPPAPTSSGSTPTTPYIPTETTNTTPDLTITPDTPTSPTTNTLNIPPELILIAAAIAIATLFLSTKKAKTRTPQQAYKKRDNKKPAQPDFDKRKKTKAPDWNKKG